MYQPADEAAKFSGRHDPMADLCHIFGAAMSSCSAAAILALRSFRINRFCVAHGKAGCLVALRA